MAEYIDKSELYKLIVNMPSNACALPQTVAFLNGATARQNEILDILDKLPTADVRENVRGEWIGYPECLKFPNAYADDHIVCSECEECFSILDNDCERFDFCPHCGTDMRSNKGG